MNKKIKIILGVLVFWVALFVIWEWWYSFPKVRTKLIPEVTSAGEGIDSIMNQAMSSYLLPGISVAIVKEGEVFYLDAIGFENLQTKDSLTVESQILVASISKLFTALGVANALAEKGISSDDPLSSLGLGEKPDSPFLANLRFQELLSHQSGVRDRNFSELIFSPSEPQSLDEWGEFFLENASNYQLDSVTYNYADSNYDLLGYLLSQWENSPFETLTRENVFLPSGMHSSTFVSTWPIEENGLTGYQKTLLWKRLSSKQITFPIFPSPSSGLLTTTKDMSLAMLHLLRGEMGKYQKTLKWLSIEGSNVPLGFQKAQINGSEWIGHFGGQAGYSSLLFFSKEEETGIFLFANAKDTKDFRISLANQIITYISAEAK